MVVNTVMVHIVGMLGTQLFWGANPRAPIGGSALTELGLQRALQLEQRALALGAAGVAAQLAPRRPDAVAGDHDRDRVTAQRRARRAVGARVAGALGHLAVARVPAERD